MDSGGIARYVAGRAANFEEFPMPPITRIGGNSINARVVVHGGIAYVSGIVADDKSGGVAGQTQQILARIDKHLAGAGTSKYQLLSATIWLSDMSKKDDLNKVWSEWIDPANPPVRACVGAELSSDKTLVEIMVTAAID
jgi:enamine deaminase RidA (YjgF/YER057c/UK114 family)